MNEILKSIKTPAYVCEEAKVRKNLELLKYVKEQSGAKISLGLDLQGGLHMLLGVETNEAIHSKIKSVAGSINYYAKKEDVLIDKFKIKEDSVDFVNVRCYNLCTRRR